MTEKPITISDEELQAYVDQRLDAARLAEIDTQLANDAQTAARVQAYRAQNMALHTLFDPVLTESVPPRLTDKLASKQRFLPVRVAAAVAWIFVGTIVGYVAHDKFSPAKAAVFLAERAAVAHVVYTADVLHPVEITADQEKHLVQWLSKRLGKKLSAPDLSRFGYQLVGGRLLPGDKGPAAQFMYQDAPGARLTLYVSTLDSGAHDSAFRYEKDDGVQVLYWVDRNLGFALVGDTERARLLDIAHVTYQALNF